MIQVKRLRTLIDRFRNATILVVGDVMIDKYIWGNVSRIAAEAPVPVVDVLSESLRPGGAANVVNNICALGGKVRVCSVVGNDAAGATLRQALQQLGVDTTGLLTDATRPTTLKTRIIVQHQQVARFDHERREDLQPELEARLIEAVQQALPAVDGVIIEDYGKGLVTPALVQHIVSLTAQAGKMLAVDPKTNHFPRYAGVSVITPNHHEAGAAVQTAITDHASLVSVGKQLLDQLACQLVLITRGGEGMSLFERQAQMVTHVPAMAQEVYDVTGAGDTVVAALALGLAAGGEPVDAMVVSNAAAGVVVGKLGTATVSAKELTDALANMRREHIAVQREHFA